MADSGVILLRGGTVLQHNERDEIDILRITDVLIDGGRIAAIGKDLPSSPDMLVLDCTDKIVSPGLIDTHHHVWQTQLKGRHTDHTIVDYTAAGNWQPFNYTPIDIFWGELGGLLEAIDGGTTCVVDHAHMAHTREHGEHTCPFSDAITHRLSAGWFCGHSCIEHTINFLYWTCSPNQVVAPR